MQYQTHIILAVITILLISSVFLYSLRLKKSLTEKTEEIKKLKRNLEKKTIQPQKKVHSLLDRELYLREIMQTVADISELLITSKNIDKMLSEACLRFTMHAHYGFCWIGLLSGDTIGEIFSSEHPSKYLVPPPYFPFDQDDDFSQTPAAECIVRNKTIIDSQKDQPSNKVSWHEAPSLEGFAATVSLPLRAEKYVKPLGFLSVYTLRKEGFEQEEVAMLEELAGDIGFAINALYQKKALEQLEMERTANYEETIFSFVIMIEQRDTYTAGHTTRVARYCDMIAREMGIQDQEIQKLRKAAILHDIGKISTPDSVLLKPGKLTTLDYDLIKQHASAGYEMLSQIKMYEELTEIVLYHHEKHDGTGYPCKLQGEEIPLLARVMAVADAFDAMTTNRIYKPRMTLEEALIELASKAGSQFHPQVVETALRVLKDAEPPDKTTQLPETELEKRRFSYFFNDRLTGLFNEDYLQIVLQNIWDQHTFRCIHIIHLENLEKYNKEFGWEKGNQVLLSLAGELQKGYPEALLFRVYGNDFAMLFNDHTNIDANKIGNFPCLHENEIIVQLNHHDLSQEKQYTFNKLERLELVTVKKKR